MTANRLAVSLPGIELKNPIMPSAGSMYYGLDHLEDFDLNILGAMVLKTTTVDERRGNPQPWIIETSAGIMNSVGLANPGMENVKRDFLPKLAQAIPDEPTILSLAGETVAEYAKLAAYFDDVASITAFEINLSCPNVDKGGLEFGVDPESAAEVIKAVKAVTNKPLYAKLSPNVTDIKPIAIAVETAGADAIVLINTVIGMSLDLKSRAPRLYRGTGGISGDAVHPIAVRFVYEAAQAVQIPIIGVGGINNVDDALELLLAGATAVQVGHMNSVDRLIMPKIIADLPAALDKYGFADVSEVTHALKKFPADLATWEKEHTNA
ncbi:MAG: dihydroorotate dehydrogenase [Lactobacillaceae bacterium]|nr:dihydroorotate dehydrogenase [Lactobacillaceae bacterium]